ncbi:MAG: hypothetical protein LUE17_11465 [Planctomycetaceae bacterium]|nr:hypothetical protein [Planctomycetaceae bacterium]
MSISSTGSSTSNYTGPTRMTGLVSGFDTTSIVEQLMALERQPLNKLDIKKQTEELRLQAYQAVNTYVLKFRASIAGLSSSKLWNAKTATSTNEKSLTANASEYAVNGSYSFKVAQLAAVTQYMSKGMASSKTPLVKQEKVGDEDPKPYKLGELNLSSAKTRVDNSAKLEQLNGGKGVFRGSVRVTDGKGTTSTIDLSSCDTVDDVVRTLNESSGAQINAEIKNGVICVSDASGVDGGTLKIQNVGTGTTATDLGIAGVANGTSGQVTELQGRNVYTMGKDTSLELLNDGLGVEEGMIRMQVTDEEGYYLYVDIDVNDCETVGDVMNRANNEIKRLIELDANSPDGGMHTSNLEGLAFGVSADGLSFSLTGTKKDLAYACYDVYDEARVSNTYPSAGLGLNGVKIAKSDDEELVFDRVFGGVNSPMLKNLNGTAGVGIGASDNDGRIKLPVDLNDNTPLSALNNGNGYTPSLPILQIVTHEGGKEVSDHNKKDKIVYHQNIITPQALENFYATHTDPTVGEFKNFVNDQIQAYANNPDNNAASLNGLRFDLDSEGVKRFSVYGAQGGYSYEIGGTLATALGIGRADSNKTMVEKYLDKDSAEYDAYKKDLEDFFNIGKASVLEDNEVFDEKTTLGDMLGQLHGLKRDDFSSTTAYNDAVKAWQDSAKADPAGTLASLFNQNLELTTTYEKSDGTMDTATVSIDVASLFDADNPFNADLTVDKFMETVNKAIATEFAALTDPVSGDPLTIVPPKLGVNATANNLQWTNVDFSRPWEIAGGDAFERMNLAKNTAQQNDAGQISFSQQGEHALAGDLNIAQPGYIQYRDVTEENADTVFIGELNAGLGLVFGKADDTLEITMDGHTISFTYQELADKMATKASGSGELKDVTVKDYVESLNDLVQEKLIDVNADISDPDKHLDFTIKVGTNGLEVADFKNIKNFTMGGALAQEVRTGINAGGIVIESGKSYQVGELLAGVHVQQEIKGLGVIEVSLGSGKAITLETDGLTQSNTLAELINRLNQELDKHVADIADPDNGIDPDWANVRFTLNEAGTGIAVENNSGKRVTFHDTVQTLVDQNGNPVPDKDGNDQTYSDGNYLAQDLGLISNDESKNRIEPYSFYNATSLNRSMISRATKIDEYYSSTKEKGSIVITNTAGETGTLSLEGIETIGDLMDLINDQVGTYLHVKCHINDHGDGLEFYEE